MRYRKIFAATAIILLVAAIILAWLVPGGPKTAPDITLLTVDGGQVALSGLQGNPVLVTFWATTCRTCVREIPEFIELYRELSPQGLKIIAIAMYYDPPDRVLSMIRGRDIPYTVALDIRADAARAFGNVRLTPTAFLIAPDGSIVYRKTGELPFERLRKDIMKMLEQPAAGNPRGQADRVRISSK
jgi:peroxiredoxin